MTLPELSSLVAHATAPGRFYRSLYGMPPGAPALSAQTWEEWRALPLLTKSDLLKVPLAERSFLPLSQVDYISSSSGTSGTLPLFSPRTQLLEYEFRTGFYEFTGAALSSKLVPHQQERFLFKRNLPPRVIVIDPRNPSASARLARAAGVDAIFAFLFHMPIIAPYLVRLGVAEQIRFIELAGETCSRSQYESMRSTFPNAVIVSTYGLSEVERSPVGIPCRPMSGEEPLTVYHAKEGLFLELYDPETQTIVAPLAGAEGELIITAGAKQGVFPTIRYRSGDTVRVISESCPKHHSWSFTVLGRVDIDFVKIPGGMLKADEVERVLHLFADSVSDTFELRVSSKESSRIETTLFVETKDRTVLSSLAHEIAGQLRVAPSFTYAQGVDAGLYRPLICQPLSAAQDQGKRKRIVRV